MIKGPLNFNSSSVSVRRFSLSCFLLLCAQNTLSANSKSCPEFPYSFLPFRFSLPAVRCISSPAKMCCETTKMCCENAKTSSEKAEMCCDVAKTSSETAKMLREMTKTCSEVTNVSSEIAMMNKNVTKMSSELPKVCSEKAKTFSEAGMIPFDLQKPDFLLKISNKVTNKHNLLVIDDHKFQTPNVYKAWGEFLITTK